jgi:DNA repair exonuclease SbcCD ATPase subunit
MNFNRGGAMPTPAVIEATEALARIQREEQQQRREDLIQQLTAVRAELRTAEDRYKQLHAQIHKEREDKANAQSHVEAAAEAVRDSWLGRPKIAEYLPDDPEVVAWRTQHQALERRHEERIAKRNALPDPQRDLGEAISYEGPMGRIATLRFSQQNLVNALEGRSGITRIEGGVFGVY